MLDRTWQRPRPTRAQMRLDAWIGLGAAAISVLTVEVYRSGFGTPLGWQGVEAYLWFGLAGLLLAGRRSYPLTVLTAQAAIFIVIGERLGLLGATFAIQMVFFASLYAAWAWSRRPRSLAVVSALVIVAMFGWLLLRLLEPGGLPEDDRGGLIDTGAAVLLYSLLINIVYFFGAMAWGQVAYRGARQRAAAEQATALELALAEQRERQAIGEERVRIARDLHDVVAHHVSSIGIQATGAERVLEADPSAARAALTTIGSSAREAVAQMHQLVHLLRVAGEGSDRAPQPGLTTIATLATDTGRPIVEHRVVGAEFAVPETVGLSLFRVAQEAIANVRRHSSAKTVSVVVRYVEQPRVVELEVLDDGRAGATAKRRPVATSPVARTASGEPGEPGPSGVSGGFGLTGVRERVALHGGECEIGPRPQGGFRVRVRIPVAAL